MRHVHPALRNVLGPVPTKAVAKCHVLPLAIGCHATSVAQSICPVDIAVLHFAEKIARKVIVKSAATNKRLVWICSK
jgi:hypothetical protein